MEYLLTLRLNWSDSSIVAARISSVSQSSFSSPVSE